MNFSPDAVLFKLDGRDEIRVEADGRVLYCRWLDDMELIPVDITGTRLGEILLVEYNYLRRTKKAAARFNLEERG
jgi:hypothetical protein